MLDVLAYAAKHEIPRQGCAWRQRETNKRIGMHIPRQGTFWLLWLTGTATLRRGAEPYCRPVRDKQISLLAVTAPPKINLDFRT